MLEENDEYRNTNPLRPMNCLIIPREPIRGGEKTKVEPKTNQHIMIEFALNVKKITFFIKEINYFIFKKVVESFTQE
jgi:hypothetical protein